MLENPKKNWLLYDQILSKRPDKSTRRWSGEKGGKSVGNDFVSTAILRSNPRIRRFAEAVLKDAEESGVTVNEMKKAFEVLEGIAEVRIHRTRVETLGMTLPKEKE